MKTPWIRGSCLCGVVQFEITAPLGPFELCHCHRCRKASGSAFVAGLTVQREAFHWLSGQDQIHSYEAPLVESLPAYRVCFCRHCGSPVPDPESHSAQLEIAAGLLDDDPEQCPDKHIYVEHKAAWFEIRDDLPQFDKTALAQWRQKSGHQKSDAKKGP